MTAAGDGSRGARQAGPAGAGGGGHEGGGGRGGSRSAPPWWLAVALGAAGLVLAALAVGTRPEGSPAADAALRDGNRLAREGRLDDAVAAYEAGWRASASPAEAVLAYNLGTVHHRRGRLPEALLWYRRAEAAGLQDPWLADNLALVLAEAAEAAEAAQSAAAAAGLVTATSPPGGAGALTRLAGRAPALAWVAAVLAWVAAALAALAALAKTNLASRPPAWSWVAVAVPALALSVAALALAAWGPRPAVLLAPCGGGGLAAGSEVWVSAPGLGGRLLGRVLGTPPELDCPPGAVAPVGGGAAGGGNSSLHRPVSPR